MNLVDIKLTGKENSLKKWSIWGGGHNLKDLSA